MSTANVQQVLQVGDHYYVLGDVDGVRAWAMHPVNPGDVPADLLPTFAVALAASVPAAALVPPGIHPVSGAVELDASGQVPVPTAEPDAEPAP